MPDVTLTTEQVADLVTTTLGSYDPPKWQDLTTDLQAFYALPQVLKEEKVQLEGGVKVVRFLQTDHLDSARAVGLNDIDRVNDRDMMEKIEEGWRHCTANMSLERRIVNMNRGEAQLVKLVKTKEHGMMVALAEAMEQWMWTLLSADDGITPIGIPYWINKYPSGNTALGFTGTLPWTGVYPGGLNHARFRNIAGKYTDFSKTDLLPLMRKGYRIGRFMPPVKHSANYDRGSERYGFYTTIEAIMMLEMLGESQNDNLGKDLASMDGQILFRRCPIHWVPQLEADTHNPIYGIDWAQLYPVFLEGEYMNRSPAQVCSEQHTRVRVHIDCTYTFMAHDLRRLMVLSQDTDKS